MLKSKSRLSLFAAAALMSVSLGAVASALPAIPTAVVQVEVCAQPGELSADATANTCEKYTVHVPSGIKEASFDVGFAKPYSEEPKARGTMFGISTYMSMNDKKPGVVVVRYNGHFGEETKKYNGGTTTELRMQSSSQVELAKGGSKSLDFNKIKVTLTRID